MKKEEQVKGSENTRERWFIKPGRVTDQSTTSLIYHSFYHFPQPGGSTFYTNKSKDGCCSREISHELMSLSNHHFVGSIYLVSCQSKGLELWAIRTVVYQSIYRHYSMDLHLINFILIYFLVFFFKQEEFIWINLSFKAVKLTHSFTQMKRKYSYIYLMVWGHLGLTLTWVFRWTFWTAVSRSRQ